MNTDIAEVCKGCAMAHSGCFIQTYNLDIPNCPCSICLVKTMCLEAREHVGCNDRVTHILDSNRKRNNVEIYIQKAADNLRRGIQYLERMKKLEDDNTKG